MKAFSKLVVFCGLALFAFQSGAEILLEPYAGIAMGTSKGGNPTAVSQDIKPGPFFGARVGYANAIGFMAGAEFVMGKFKDEDLPGTDVSSDITFADPGVFVGFEAPVLVRGYLTYFPMAKAKIDAGTSSLTIKGNAIKVGIGTTVFPVISINLEYEMATYNKYEGGGTSGSLSPNKSTVNLYGLSVSAPIEF